MLHNAGINPLLQTTLWEDKVFVSVCPVIDGTLLETPGYTQLETAWLLQATTTFLPAYKRRPKYLTDSPQLLPTPQRFSFYMQKSEHTT
jgi:hypothetical protein